MFGTRLGHLVARVGLRGPIGTVHRGEVHTSFANADYGLLYL